jgi:hypothetical protein
VLGSLWNGKDTPPETNADGRNDIRKIRSRSGHEIIFDDGAQGNIDIHLKDNKRKVRMDPDGIVISDDSGNQIEIKSLSGELNIKSNTKISLQSNVIEIKANASMTLQASGTMTIKGALVLIN